MSDTGLKDSDQHKQPLSQRATIPPTARDQQSAEDNAPDFDSVPSSIGQYEIKRLIGQGAMGMVYLAHDNRANRDVALKIPTIRLGEESETLKRFHREARSAATISHPNICTIYQVGRSEGVNYIAMQYIDGRPLSDFVRPEDPPPADQVALIVKKIADAMDQAHQKHIVHRDLKPDNILIDANREPVVMDFGLALNVDGPTDIRLTQAGTIMGSPAYMSPEQIENDLTNIGPAADIYSLGVVFYELLTGQLPFEGSFASVMAQILKDEPKFPSQVYEGIHPMLDAICMKMLAKAPDGRYASMGEVAAALEKIHTELQRVRAQDHKKQEAELSAFDKTKAIRDARVERLEMAKRHVEALRKDGAYNTAIKMLQQMARLRDPRYAKYARWATELIPVLKQEPERIRAQRAEAADTARQLIDRHEYAEAVDLLQQIPRSLRTKPISAVLKEAVKLHAECEQLAEEIREELKTHETRDTLPKVERLLELRPQSERARKWYFKLTGRKYGEAAWRNLPPAFFWPVVVVTLSVFAAVGWVIIDALTSTDDPNSTVLVPGWKNPGGGNNVIGPVDPDGNPGGKVVVPVEPPKPGDIIELGEPVDLLALIDPEKHKVAGNWSSDGIALVNHGGPYGRLQIPFSPPEEYQLNITATRISGKAGLHVGLVKGERQFTAVFDSSGRNSFLHVFDRLQDFKKNSTMFDGPLFHKDVPAEIVCKVRNAGVAITVDGRTVIDWEGGFSRLTPYGGTAQVPNRSQLVLGGDNPFRFTKIELRPLKTVPEFVAVGERISLLKLIDIQKHQLRGKWAFEDKALVTTGGDDLLQIPYSPPEEYQVNVTATPLGGKGEHGIGLSLVGGGGDISRRSSTIAIGITGSTFWTTL